MFIFNSDPLVGLVITTTIALFYKKFRKDFRALELKIRYLYSAI